MKFLSSRLPARTSPLRHRVRHHMRLPLVGIAQRNPQTLADLHGISGIGTKKLEAYGAEVLRVIQLSTKL